MNQTDTQLKTDVMQRVNRIHTWRVYIRPCLIESGILGCLVAGSALLVSIPHVFINTFANRSLFSFSNYIIEAFLRTEFPIKVLALAVLVLFILLIRDIALFFGLDRFIRRSYSVQ